MHRGDIWHISIECAHPWPVWLWSCSSKQIITYQLWRYELLKAETCLSIGVLPAWILHSPNVFHVRSVLLTPSEGYQNTCTTIPKHQTMPHFWACLFHFWTIFFSKTLEDNHGCSKWGRGFHIPCTMWCTINTLL